MNSMGIQTGSIAVTHLRYRVEDHLDHSEQNMSDDTKATKTAFPEENELTNALFEEKENALYGLGIAD